MQSSHSDSDTKSRQVGHRKGICRFLLRQKDAEKKANALTRPLIRPERQVTAEEKGSPVQDGSLATVCAGIFPLFRKEVHMGTT